MKLKALLAGLAISLSAIAPSVVNAQTVRFNNTEAPSVFNANPVTGDEWASFGITVANAYWYTDSRDTFDGMGLSVNIDPAEITFTSVTPDVTFNWWVIAAASNAITVNAYDSGHSLLGSFFAATDGEHDLFGTNTLGGGVSYLEWSGSPGYAQISDITFTTPVPEPETYAMLLAGLGLLGFAARRRKLKEAAAA